MLFDPFEEQFHLPSRLVNLGNGQCRKDEVVGEELESLSRWYIQITYAPQWLRVGFGGVNGGQDDGVIGSDSGGLVHWMRVAALEQDVGFGAHYEEGRAECEDVKALEIQVAAVDDVERTGLWQNLVFAVCNAYKRWDIATQVQQRVQFDGSLVPSEASPWE